MALLFLLSMSRRMVENKGSVGFRRRRYTTWSLLASIWSGVCLVDRRCTHIKASPAKQWGSEGREASHPV